MVILLGVSRVADQPERSRNIFEKLFSGGTGDSPESALHFLAFVPDFQLAAASTAKDMFKSRGEAAVAAGTATINHIGNKVFAYETGPTPYDHPRV